MTLFTKRLLAITFSTAILSSPVFAQTSDHSSHDMKQIDHSKMDHSTMDHSKIKMDRGQMQHGEMSHDDMMKARSQHMVEAIGVIKKVDKEDRLVSISHGSIPAISWPAMTMKFPVSETMDLSNFKKGQQVQFTLHRAADGSLPLVELCEAQSQDTIAGLCAPGMNHGPQDAKPAPKDHSHMGH